MARAAVSAFGPAGKPNTVEGYFSIFKRGIYGVYHHVSADHLKRYLGEFDFRYNHRIALGYDDTTRATLAVKGIAGKRLTYRRPDDTARPVQLKFSFMEEGPASAPLFHSD